MDVFVTIMINASLVLVFLTILAVVGTSVGRFLSGNLSDHQPH